MKEQEVNFSSKEKPNAVIVYSGRYHFKISPEELFLRKISLETELPDSNWFDTSLLGCKKRYLVFGTSPESLTVEVIE